MNILDRVSDIYHTDPNTHATKSKDPTSFLARSKPTHNVFIGPSLVRLSDFVYLSIPNFWKTQPFDIFFIYLYNSYSILMNVWLCFCNSTFVWINSFSNSFLIFSSAGRSLLAFASSISNRRIVFQEQEMGWRDKGQTCNSPQQLHCRLHQ